MSIGAAQDGAAVPSPAKPGTSPLPAGPAKLVMRLANPDAMLNETVRAQSEVATMVLMRDALSSLNPRLVPAVYGWAPSSPTGNGWVLIELMPGEQLNKKFHDLKVETQRDILLQMAQVFKAIQAYDLPPPSRATAA